MTTVENVYAGSERRSHDISLDDGTDIYGLIFREELESLQEVPMSAPAQTFQVTQKSYIGGRGRTTYSVDPTGYADGYFAWTMTDEKVFGTPFFRFGTGYRNMDKIYPDSGGFTWTPAHVTAFSETFSPATYTTTGTRIWLRRVGYPGTMTFTLKISGGATLKTATVQVLSGLPGAGEFYPDSGGTTSLPVLYTFSHDAQALSSGTTYQITLTPAAGDNMANHWEYATTGGDGIFVVTDNTSLSDTRPKFRPWLFDYYGAKYMAYKTSLWINGDRGTATAGGNDTLTDSGKSWTSNAWEQARVKIIEGTGAGQNRLISGNNGTVLTVSVAWDVNPDNTSKYVIYNTPRWTAITLNTALTGVTGKPVEANQMCYFPQGSTAILRMSNAHQSAADGTNTADHLVSRLNPLSGIEQVIASVVGESDVKVATAPGPNVNFTFGSDISVGSPGVPITNLYNHNGTVYIMKEDGAYTIDYNNKVTYLSSAMRDMPSANTGYAAGSNGSTLFISWNHSVEYLIGQTFLDLVNWKAGYEGMDIRRRGDCVAITGGVGWTFFAFDGGTLNFSSVLAWNERGLHEIYRSQKTGRRIKNISWQSQPDANGRLWIVDGDDLIYIDFPNEAANPLKDSDLMLMPFWSITTGTIDHDNIDLAKFLSYVKITADNLENAYDHKITVEYQVNEYVGGTTWTDIGDAVLPFVQRLSINAGNVYQLRLRISGYSNHTQHPCKLISWTLEGEELPPLRYQYVGQFSFASDQKTRTTAQDHNPQNLIDWLLVKAKRMDKLTMRSVVPEMDDKIVTVSAPAIVNDYVVGKKRKGAFSLLIRETGL